jgi:glucose-6-phosphate isomerase
MGQLLAPQDLQQAVTSGWAVLDQQQAAPRIWQHDATLWKSDSEIQEKIKNRLGWLTVVDMMQKQCSEITALVDQVRQAGYKSAVLLGMGGSSLCPEVLRLTFGVAPGYLELFVLDTTDPDTIHTVEQQIDLHTTLFIVASKSGGTIETLSHFKYFFAKESELLGAKAGEHFIAITDPATSLEQLAHECGFRHTFLNPPAIGGRYSALSFFGLVPGALIGMDIDRLLTQSDQIIQASKAELRAQDNPGLWLGAIMGTLGKKGYDKITFVLSPEISSFGYWVEQLIAESTGKEGRGLLPVEGEQLGTPAVYGHDRLFVYLRLADGANVALDRMLQTLQEAGHPVIRLDLKDRYELGAEFFRWELATVVASMFLDINPLDEPNVQESKDNTRRILTQYQQEHELPALTPVVTYNAPHIQVFGTENGTQTLTDYLHTFLEQIQVGDYIAIMAYVQKTEATEDALQALRMRLRDTYQVATTVGYGPRFLHSTGQFHKGGANNGIFIQVTGDIYQDAPIPGESYTFGVLKAAQALGDLFSLESHERRNIRLQISGDLAPGLQIATQAI